MKYLPSLPQNKLSTHFQEFFRKFREAELNLSQGQMGHILNVDQSVISKWETGRQTPDLATIDRMVGLWGIERASQLLGLLPKNTYNDIEWIEFVPNYVQGKQREEITLGIQFFHLLVKFQKDAGECTLELKDSWQNLNKYLINVIKTRCLQIISVPQDIDKENLLRELYPNLRNVIVAKVPKNPIKDVYMDGAVIRTEFVTFLAVTKF